jgi:hypothetical protein
MKQSIRNLISHNSVKLARKNTHMTQSNDPKLQPVGKLCSFLCQYVFGYLPKHLLRLHTTQCLLVIRHTTTVSSFVLNWTIPVQMQTANINMAVWCICFLCTFEIKTCWYYKNKIRTYSVSVVRVKAECPQTVRHYSMKYTGLLGWRHALSYVDAHQSFGGTCRWRQNVRSKYCYLSTILQKIKFQKTAILNSIPLESPFLRVFIFGFN